MSMSWLIIMFILGGVPTQTDVFPAKLVPTEQCMAKQQEVGQLLALAYPSTSGMVFCILAPPQEVPDAPETPV